MGPKSRASFLRSLALAALPFAVGCASVQASAIWLQMPPLLRPRYFHRAAVGPAGEIIVFAGRTGEFGVQSWETEIFDPKSKTWRDGPSAMDSLAIRSTRRSSKRLLDGTYRHSYYQSSNTLSPGCEVPPGVGTTDGRAFWFGEVAPIIFDFATGKWGQGTPPRAAPVYFDEATKQWLEETTPREDKRPARRWVTSVPKFERMGSASAAAADGTIYISGGSGFPTEPMDRHNGREYELLDALERYDPATETWTVLAPMTRARQLHAAAVGRDGKFYVFGGYGHVGSVKMREGETQAQFEARSREGEALSRNALDSVEVYDPKTNTWEQRTPMPDGRLAMGAALGADGKIYVIGGAVSYSNPRGSDKVFVYDPATDRWSKGPPLIRARFHHAVAAGRDGKIYAIGGRVNRLTSTEGTATVELLDTGNVPKPEGW